MKPVRAYAVLHVTDQHLFLVHVKVILHMPQLEFCSFNGCGIVDSIYHA